MAKVFWIIILCILFVGCFSTRPAPRQYENCITTSNDDGFLRIEVKTRNNPNKYALEIGQVYFDTIDIKDARQLSLAYWDAKVIGDLFVIEIDVNHVNRLMGNKDFIVRVLLYNVGTSRMELYMS